MGKNELPLIKDTPAIEETWRRVINLDHIVFEDLTKDLRPGALPPGRANIKQVEPLHPGRRLEAGGREDGWRQVDTADERLVTGRLQLARPAQHDGRTDAAVIGRSLGTYVAAARLDLLDPAVVGHENDERIVAELLLVDVTQQLAAGLIEPLAHRLVARHVNGLALRLVFRQQPLRRIVGRVRKKGRVPDKERLLARGIDEVENWLEPLAPDRQPGAAMPPGCRHPVSETTKLIMTLPPLT